MNAISRILCILLMGSFALVARAADVPYSVSLKRVDIADMPDLHSFTSAEYQGKLILIGGRTNGMHGFPQGKDVKGFPSFPRAQANHTVYVVDLAAGKLLGHKSVDKLPAELAGQFSATNAQSICEGPWMYLLGGYGAHPSAKTLITIPQVTAIFLPALVQAIIDPNAELDAAFAQRNIGFVPSNAAKVTGGVLKKLDGRYCLVFGHLFDGEYSADSSGFEQVYTNAIRVFELQAWQENNRVTLNANMVATNPADPLSYNSDSPYHRRDLCVENAIGPHGTPMIGIYGGVFKGGQFEGYVTPMYARTQLDGPAGLELVEDTGAVQLLSQYHCPVLQIYDQASADMYSTFFGGISQYYWDAAKKVLVRQPFDLATGTDGLPFIESVSTLKVSFAGKSAVTNQYLHQNLSFPPADARPECQQDGNTYQANYLGAETHFIPVASMPLFANGVLNLAVFRTLQGNTKTPTKIGWLVGGIAAVNRNGPPSCASALVYEISLDALAPSTDTLLLQAPQ